jgi:uncharacterized protein (TIGR03435 family)
MKLLGLFASALFVATSASAQAPAATLEFEVASVKPFSINTNGVDAVTLGAKIDGAQVRMVGLTMRDLLASAYRVKLYLVIGPEWMATERYDINAKLPEGVSPDKLPEMLQALLLERFHLQVHREKREIPVYALLLGKPPLRLKESVIDPNAPAPKAVTVTGTGGPGGVSVNMGNGSSYSFGGGKFEAKQIDAATMCTVLERFTDRPWVDLTGLKGIYDFEFTVAPEDSQTLMIRAAVSAGVQLPPQALRLLDGGGNPLEAAAEQLGLNLDGRKVPIDHIVIDQIQKTPSDN